MALRMDNMAEKLTARAVRNLRVCSHCDGLGDADRMINHVGETFSSYTHTGCFVKANKFTAVLALPKYERGKFRICDMTTKQMQKLMDSLASDGRCSKRR